MDWYAEGQNVIIKHYKKTRQNVSVDKYDQKS